MGLWNWIAGNSNSHSENSGELSQIEEKENLEFLDPSLKTYYEKAKPATPLSLAPQEVRDAYEREQKRLEENVVQDKGDPSRGLLGTPMVDDHEARKKSLQKAARDNCVELEVIHANCLNKGSFRAMGLCYAERRYFRRCCELQEQALDMLGYARGVDMDQRTRIQGKVDDLFGIVVPDGVVSNERVDLFKKAVESEIGKDQVWRVESDS
jgi:hypothetical protein